MVKKISNKTTIFKEIAFLLLSEKEQRDTYKESYKLALYLKDKKTAKDFLRLYKDEERHIAIFHNFLKSQNLNNKKIKELVSRHAKDYFRIKNIERYFVEFFKNLDRPLFNRLYLDLKAIIKDEERHKLILTRISRKYK